MLVASCIRPQMYQWLAPSQTCVKRVASNNPNMSRRPPPGLVELPVAEFLLQEVPHPSAQVAGLLVAEFEVEEVSPPAAQPGSYHRNKNDNMCMDN